MGGKLHHHVGENLLLPVGTVHPYKGNSRVLNLHGRFLVKLGACLCQNLACGGIHHILCQYLSVQTVLKGQFLIKFVSADFCKVISSGVKEHAVKETFCTVNR